MPNFTDSFHQLTAFLISQLAAFLQLKYGANDPTESLFVAHPTAMLVAISCFMLYYLLHLLLLRSPTTRFSAVAQLLLVSSAHAAASALVAALLPPWATASLCVIFVLLSTGDLFCLFGNLLVIEDEDEDKDEDEEGETWTTIRVYGRRVRGFCGSVARFFGHHQPQPILPIRI